MPCIGAISGVRHKLPITVEPGDFCVAVESRIDACGLWANSDSLLNL